MDLSNASNPNADYRRYRGVSLEQCSEICGRDRQCNAFTYNQIYGPTCILKASFERQKRYIGAISGVKMP
ncbi:PAN domain-containing protein [Breoghania sp. L-A4]|uniref:PAN domain-containing protein n=1 Tax=Breoghania sp. L-A4 TaxID=2304600 RepID=UPI0020BFD9C5|nr:PAN domain-containing protein [Breoghania sp. L-A4]